MEHLPANIVIDHMIEAEACKGLGNAHPCNGADQRFNAGLQDINSFIRSLGTKTRVKRSTGGCQTGLYKSQERQAWSVINKKLSPADEIDSHMRLADLMDDSSGKWTNTMKRMSDAEIDMVVKNLKKSANNARDVSASHGEVPSAQHGHAYRYNTYDRAVASLKQFKDQRPDSVPGPAYPPAPKAPSTWTGWHNFRGD